MVVENRSNEPGAQRVKAGVMPLFSTWVYLCDDGPRHLNPDLVELAHRLMQDQRNAGKRTNAGGWHYAFDFFKLTEPVVSGFRDHMDKHIRAFLSCCRRAS